MNKTNDLDQLKFYFAPLVVIACQAALFVVFLIYSIPMGMGFSLRTDIDDLFLRVVILAAGVVILCFSMIKFLGKFLKSPSRTRLTILLALLSFTGTVGLKLFTSLYSLHDSAYQRYFYDFTMILMLLSLFFLVVFGITVLISPQDGGRARILKPLTEVLLLVPYLIFFVSQLLNITLGTNILEDILEVAMILEYALLFYCIVLLFLMASRSLVLSKKIGETQYKNALVALSISFFILIGTYFLILVNSIGSYSKELEIVVLGSALLSFYFIYKGIVAPTSAKES